VIVHDDDPTITPKLIMESYQRAYRHVNGRPPAVRHQFGEWYYVNGETVHRHMLLNEITRLRAIAQKQRLNALADRKLMQRIIAKLRGM
jgi:hypothetical protein